MSSYTWQTLGRTCAADYLFPQVEGLLKNAPPGTRILDVGCGNGFFAGKLSSSEYHVVGIDTSESGIALAADAYPAARFEVLDASGDLADRLGEEPFDVVISTEVVEHVFDPLEYARACFHALRPAGRFLCSTPHHGYVKNLALALTDKFDAHWEPARTGGHIKFWSRRTLGELLSQVGFRGLDFGGAGRLPFVWKSLVVVASRSSDDARGEITRR